MREILFRGKAVGSLKWVEGFYFREAGSFIKELPSAVSTETHMVYEDTVGQYTGLTDKNGKKIFEGDIVKHYNHCEIKEYSEDIGRVFYYANTCRFLRTSKLFPDDCPEIHSSCEYEVIGNIYDNPELLKGGEE